MAPPPIPAICHVLSSFQAHANSLGRVTGEDQIALFHFLVTREAGLHKCVVNWFAVTVEVTEPPTSSRGVLLGVLDHKLNVRRSPGNERLIASKDFVVFRRLDEAVV